MEEKVYKVFHELGIPYEKIEHPELYTCDDNKKYNIKFDGTICKNLFVKNNNKSRFYLIVLPIEKRIDLKKIQQDLKETRLSFGNKEELEEKLKTKKGAVSILNIINVEVTDVIFIIDNDLFNQNKVCFHPNINTATLLFSPGYIERILNKYNVKYYFKDL